jgi:hypothetical protein
MDKRYHYEIIKQLCLWSGYTPNQAETIAYASQMVDENTKNFEVNGYRNYRSQTYNIFDKDRTDIYFSFHYVPGLSEKPAGIKDGKENKYSVISDSKLANIILDEAFNTKDLNRIGIALHAYADTWAHQGFSGKWESWNSVYQTIIPNIGHAEVFNSPDDNKHWHDYRYQDHIIYNAKRWLECCWMIIKKLGYDFEYLGDTLSGIINLVFDNTPSTFVNKWSCEEDIKKDFDNWKAFQDAIKNHKEFCMKLFKQNNL